MRTNILPREDADFYRIAFAERGVVKVRIPAMPEELDMSFRVLAPDGTEVSGWTSAPRAGASWEGEADIPAAGTYILEVRDRYNNARSAASYTMQVVRQGTAPSAVSARQAARGGVAAERRVVTRDRRGLEDGNTPRNRRDLARGGIRRSPGGASRLPRRWSGPVRA
ncbi:PPC domain-containing protein [Psychromarinibacter sp. C21-152]|uniref:PPC domain-containing protein n=1 Tax=Psychromarinibacter sediminicola TaxID=3033385 RepID=A0AAE3NRD0_9RHOB|nr:PPC domain-containing protein [Psychromarinibacter sediminicola]MDF0600601.1 PPC domain-containing protein [Psychromarinibacter sediminicola]